MLILLAGRFGLALTQITLGKIITVGRTNSSVQTKGIIR